MVLPHMYPYFTAGSGGGFQIVFTYPENAESFNDAPYTSLDSNYSWQIIMMTDTTFANYNSGWDNDFMNPGSSSWLNGDINSCGAANRTAIGDGRGLYKGFFMLQDIRQVAIVNGSTSNLTPTTHTNYRIFDTGYSNPRDSTYNESFYDILYRIDKGLRNSNYLGQGSHHNTNGDSVTLNNSPGWTQLVGGSNGYSAQVTSSNWNPGNCDKFCVWGENFDSDHDTQALCFYGGDLQSGKGDAWRGNPPSQTWGSYWGNDFHSNSATQTIATSRQTSPGNQSADIRYVLGFGKMRS